MTQPPGPQGYPQQGGYPQGPYGVPPKKSKLPWILGGVGGLLVVGGAVTAIILLTGDDSDGGSAEAADTSTAEGTARGVAAAINAKDSAGLVALTCDALKQDMQGFSQMLTDPAKMPGLPPNAQGDMANVKVSAEFQRIEQKSDTEAEAHFTLNIDGMPSEADQMNVAPPMDLPLMLNNGKWEVCDPEGHLFGSDAPSSGGGAATPPPANEVPTPSTP